MVEKNIEVFLILMYLGSKVVVGDGLVCVMLEWCYLEVYFLGM